MSTPAFQFKEIPYPSQDDIDRFMRFVEKSENCWLWSGTKSVAGYGRFFLNRQVILAHRFSFFVHHGVIPDGCLICHQCDNPGCVNPSHLWAGTHRDNFHDAVQKNRILLNEIADHGFKPTGLGGMKNPETKLTPESVREIRRLHLEEGIGKTAIARKYGMSESGIRDAISGRNWGHVK